MKTFILGKKENFINYYNALKSCGTKVVFSENIRDCLSCDRLVLTGGGDIAPELYNQKNKASYDINKNLDLQEIDLFKHFYTCDKPILGICKGLQIINVALGGTLNQDIECKEIHSRCGEKKDKLHYIKTVGENYLKKIYSEKFLVNSAHHQAIDVLAKELEINALSNDSVIEAVSHKTKSIIGVQFHPERMKDRHSIKNTVDGKNIFYYFLGL